MGRTGDVYFVIGYDMDEVLWLSTAQLKCHRVFVYHIFCCLDGSSVTSPFCLRAANDRPYGCRLWVSLTCFLRGYYEKLLYTGSL